jgi:dTDP-4-amino-4,6-dideoxygalactose transaminase
MATESSFTSDFRALLAQHGINHPRFAHGAEPFDPAKPRVLYSGPFFDQEELVAAVTALCEGKWAVSGEIVHRFELEFSKIVKQAETVAVNSGSSADLLMVAAAKKRYGWKDGDAVLVSPCGFPTTVAAIIQNGLTPIFIDIEWDTLNFDLIDIVYELEYGRDIRAILLSPVLGNPPDMDLLAKLARDYDVKLLGDLCDSLGTTWRGQPLASYCDVSTTSSYPAHHYTTLNGGTISSNDTELIRIARSMSQWGRACWCVGTGNLLPKGTCGSRFTYWLAGVDCLTDHRYVYENVGWNVQQVDCLAAIGLAQLNKLGTIHEKRRASFQRVSEILRTHVPAAQPVKVLPEANPSWFGVPVILNDEGVKARLVAHLEAHGIQTRSYFAGNLLRHPAYANLGRAEEFPNADAVLKRVFWLGAAPFYTEEHFVHIEKTLKEFTG